MKPLKSEQGLTLIVVLIMAAASLAMMASLAHVLTRSTLTSGAQKRYATALEAAQAAIAVNREFLGLRGDLAEMPAALNATISDPNCMQLKITTPTSGWGGCDATTPIDSAVASSYDMRFDLDKYHVYVKTTHTVQGNSGVDSTRILGKTGVVNSDHGGASGTIDVEAVPYLHRVEILSQSIFNPNERAKLSVLYQY